jgi:AcrR family transcriptional regulator
MSNRKTYHHGDLCKALIEGAIELISEADLSSLSLREVARRVGVSHAAPYRHFQDKEALLAAVAEEGFIKLTQAMKQAGDRAISDPLKRLEAIGVAYVKFAIAHPTHYRVMFGRQKREQDRYPSLNKAGKEAFAVLVEAIEAGQKTGKLSSEDSVQLAWAAWSSVHGLAMLIMDGLLPNSDTENMDSLINFVTRKLVEGLQITLW